ncbi:MAG TPA: hypothetical protein VGP15_16850 [Burkholderiales bacterium]|nr:hypothetical protein [Burkholderiales bacterium]
MRSVQVSLSSNAVELYFPPLRMPQVALPLAAFGMICAAIPALLIAALLPSAVADASGLLSAALIAAFVLPFAVFGAVFVLLAIYMVANALYVRIDAETIATARLLFGVVVKRKRIARCDIASVEPEIASRHQSLFSSQPVYQLVARANDRTRVVVGETLQGAAEMERIKALIENPAVAGENTSGSTS